MGETKVETAALKQAADALVGLRGDTDRADNGPIDETVEAAQALNKYTFNHSGAGDGTWASADALVAMGERFSDAVGHLKWLLGEISGNIHETHKGYTKAEQEEKAKYANSGGNRSMYDDFG
ncbi:hypothetical protein HCC61_25300 [Streptomyces sp. HNM0575]|uniref:hypothetical protein n=1 Tax=Streptomyces sp. HNM0575 TaxID=2716338 RepID=UPI00145CCBF9|nr:hypothetical protein [Streptomyces sp. HNM0575]NLU75928.1 hypothetical protein [Streptomyces sp. HNM0575]